MTSLRLAISFSLLTAAVAAGQEFSGAYRYVHFTYSDGARLEAASTGGTLRFEASGVAQWGDKAARYEPSGPHEATLSAGAWKLLLRSNQDGGVLIGSAAGEAGRQHHLLVAVRSAENVAPRVLSGGYGLASLALGKGEAAGLATAFVRANANGIGRFTRAEILGHAAGVDDVNRREEQSAVAFELKSDATGVMHWQPGSDVLPGGAMRMAVSADGALLLGWSADPSNPAICLGVRQSAQAAAFSFQGRFWMAEMLAENSFVFQQSTRLSSAWGSLVSNRGGGAYVAQRVLSEGEVTHLATTNQYRAGSDGAHGLAPRLEAGFNNFAFNETGFVSAQVGVAGQLTLGHGLVFGMAAPITLPALATAAAPLLPDAPVVPGALMVVSSNLSDLGGVTVRVNGVDALVDAAASTAERLTFQAPDVMAGAAATVELASAGKVVHTLRAHRAASAPAVYTVENSGVGAAVALHPDGSPVTLLKPAAPGETITIPVTALGAAPTLRVLVDGLPGEISSVEPVEGQPGRKQVLLVLPKDLNIAAGATRELPLALATPEAFSDLADIVVARP